MIETMSSSRSDTSRLISNSYWIIRESEHPELRRRNDRTKCNQHVAHIRSALRTQPLEHYQQRMLHLSLRWFVEALRFVNNDRPNAARLSRRAELSAAEFDTLVIGQTVWLLNLHGERRAAADMLERWLTEDLFKQKRLRLSGIIQGANGALADPELAGMLSKRARSIARRCVDLTSFFLAERDEIIKQLSAE